MRLSLLILILSVHYIQLNSQDNMFTFTIEEIEPRANKGLIIMNSKGFVLAATLENIIKYYSLYSGEFYEYKGKRNIFLEVTYMDLRDRKSINMDEIFRKILDEIIDRYNLIYDLNESPAKAIRISFEQSQIKQPTIVDSVDYWTTISGDAEHIRSSLKFNFLVHFLKPNEEDENDRNFIINVTLKELMEIRGNPEKVLAFLKKHDIHGEIVEVPYVRLL